MERVEAERKIISEEERNVQEKYERDKREFDRRKRDKAQVKEFLDQVDEEEVKRVVESKIDEDLRKDPNNRLRKRGVLPIFEFEGRATDRNTDKGKITSAWVALQVFIDSFRETSSLQEFALPESELTGKVAEKVLNKLTKVERIPKEASPYLLKLIKKLYEENERVQDWLQKEDFVALYYIDDDLAKKVVEGIKEALYEVGDDSKVRELEQVLKESANELERNQLGFVLEDPVEESYKIADSIERERRMKKIALTASLKSEDLEALGEYWGRIGKAQEEVRRRILQLKEDRHAALESGDDEKVKAIEREISLLQQQIQEVDVDVFLEGKLEKVRDILEEWIGRGVISRDIVEDIVFTAHEWERFKKLNKLALVEEELIASRFGGMLFDIESMGLTPDDFYKLTPQYIAAHFNEFFEWVEEGGRGKLVFKNNQLFLDTMRVLHKILRYVGGDYREEWQNAFDPSREGLAIKLLKYLTTRAISQAEKGGKLYATLEKFAQENEIDFELLRLNFQSLMSRLRVYIDNEFSAHVFAHEFYRLIVHDKLRSLEALQNLFVQFDAEKASIIFGGFQKELIDLAARTFEMWLNDSFAYNGNQMDTDFFRTLFDARVLLKNPQEHEAFSIFMETALELIRNNPSYRELLNISDTIGIDERELTDYLLRAWHFGVARSLMEKSLGIIAAVEPPPGYADTILPDKLLQTYNPRLSWLLGRGKENLSTVLLYLIRSEVRKKVLSRAKGWVPESVWNRITEMDEESFEKLAEIVGDANALIAERLERQYGVERAVMLVRHWMQRFSLPGPEDRAGWREEDPLKRAYDSVLKEIVGRDLWENYREGWIDITRNWGTAFLWGTVEKRVKKEIEEGLLKSELGDDYEDRYTPGEIEKRKDKILKKTKGKFKNLAGENLDLSKEEFEERKKWQYKGKILYMAFERTPVSFLSTVTRLTPGLDKLYEVNGQLIPTHTLLFEMSKDEILNLGITPGMSEDEKKKLRKKNWKLAKEVMKFREEAFAFWETYQKEDLKELARAWWELRKEMFEVLKSQGKIPQNATWERDGAKHKDIIDGQITAANVKLTRRLLAGKPGERYLNVREYVQDRGLDSLSEEEKVIYKVFFDPQNSNRISARFENIDFADEEGKELVTYGDEEKDIFTQTAQVYWIKNGEGFPVVGETDRSEVEKYLQQTGTRLFERDINDRMTIIKYHEEIIKFESAYKAAALKGDFSAFEEILKATSSLKGIFGSDFVYDTNEIWIEKFVQFMQEHWLIRLLPPVLSDIAGFIFGKSSAISRLIFGKTAHTMNDEDIRNFVREMAAKGYIKEKHVKRIEARLRLSDNIYGIKAGTKIFIIIMLIIIFYYIKRALEEETEDQG